MPIYEYDCDTCDKSVEVLQKMTASAPRCDECNDAPRMKRKVSRTTFLLRGGGWADDGYSR